MTDGGFVGWRTFGPTLRTDAFHINFLPRTFLREGGLATKSTSTQKLFIIHTTTKNLWLTDDLHYLEWGRSYHTKLPHILFWEIKMKNNFQSSPKPKTPILRLHKTNVACFFNLVKEQSGSSKIIHYELTSLIFRDHTLGHTPKTPQQIIWGFFQRAI